jgi:acetoin utilization deacetylase AcuC-like enzyme
VSHVDSMHDSANWESSSFRAGSSQSTKLVKPNMKIVFNDRFYNSEYASDGASAPGRMEAIMGPMTNESGYQIVQCDAAELQDIVRVHESDYIEAVKKDAPRYDMALLSAGGAIRASRIAIDTEPAFACIRPPGHHAHPSSAWGYCVFCNMTP